VDLKGYDVFFKTEMDFLFDDDDYDGGDDNDDDLKWFVHCSCFNNLPKSITTNSSQSYFFALFLSALGLMGALVF
jgi:hypothetical protein